MNLKDFVKGIIETEELDNMELEQCINEIDSVVNNIKVSSTKATLIK